MNSDLKIDPKTTQDRPKTGPRVSRRHPFLILIFVFDFGPFWDPFGVDLESLLDFKIGPKSVPKSIKNQIKPTYPHQTAPRGPKSAPRGPKTLPGASRLLQEASKTLPRGSQEAPKTARGPSKRPQECPKMVPRDIISLGPPGASNTPQEGLTAPQEHPKDSQDSTKRPPGGPKRPKKINHEATSN